MATKKSTTKAKVTPKKTTITKGKKATASAKLTKNTVNTTTTAKTVVIKTNKKTVRSSFERLRGLQLLSAGLFALLAIAAGYFIKDTTFNVWIGHLTRDDLASRATTVFAPAIHNIYDLNIRWTTVVILAISAISPLLMATRWKKQYQLNIDAQVMPQRWIDMAVTSALMIETVALLSGVHDVMTLKLVSGLMVVTCLLGWLSDKQNRDAIKPDWCAYVLALITGSLPWILIAVTAISTYIFGLVRSPWYVYALYATTLLGFGAMALNQRLHYRRANQWKFEVVERNYVVINLLVKVAFAAVLIAGLHR